MVTHQFVRKTAVRGWVDVYACRVRLSQVAPAAVVLVAVGAYVWSWDDQIDVLRDHYELGYAVGAPVFEDPFSNAEGQRECWRLTLDRYGVDSLDEDGTDEPRMFWNGCLDAVMGSDSNTSSTHLQDILND